MDDAIRGLRPVVLNTWKLATHKIEYNTIWRPIYDQNTTVTEVLATQKLVPATHLLRTTALEQCFSTGVLPIYKFYY